MDDGTARAFLEDRFGPEARVTVMRPGEWSAVYGVQTATEDLVARFTAYGDDFERDAYMARYTSAALPIPRINEWGPLHGGFYAIAGRVTGEHVDQINETELRHVLPSLFAALDAIRAIDLSASSGFGGWRADGRTQHPTWQAFLLGVATDSSTRGGQNSREQLQASSIGLGAFDEGYDQIRSLAALCPEERHIVHDDLMNRNVLVSNGRVSAVLDWGSSVYGDFLYDLAKLVFYQPWRPAWGHIDFSAEARAHYDAISLAVPHFDERLRCYCLRIGLADMAYSAFRERFGQGADVVFVDPQFGDIQVCPGTATASGRWLYSIYLNGRRVHSADAAAPISYLVSPNYFVLAYDTATRDALAMGLGLVPARCAIP